MLKGLVGQGPYYYQVKDTSWNYIEFVNDGHGKVFRSHEVLVIN